MSVVALILSLGAIHSYARANGGEQAEARMKALLASFDEKGPFGLQALGSQDTPVAKRWCVMLTGPSGTAYKGWFGGPTGEITMWRGSEQEAYAGIQKPSTNLPNEAKLRRWLKGIGSNERMRLVSMTSNREGIGTAYFAILRNGYPFVSDPYYGYRFTFSTAEDKFISLSANEKLPPVDDVAPKIDEATAEATVTRLVDSPISKSSNSGASMSITHRSIGKPQLGYYLQPGKTKAQLVWRLEFMITASGRFGSRGSSSAMLIDAVTGDQIKTKWVP